MPCVQPHQKVHDYHDYHTAYAALPHPCYLSVLFSSYGLCSVYSGLYQGHTHIPGTPLPCKRLRIVLYSFAGLSGPCPDSHAGCHAALSLARCRLPHISPRRLHVQPWCFYVCCALHEALSPSGVYPAACVIQILGRFAIRLPDCPMQRATLTWILMHGLEPRCLWHGWPCGRGYRCRLHEHLVEVPFDRCTILADCGKPATAIIMPADLKPCYLCR